MNAPARADLERNPLAIGLLFGCVFLSGAAALLYETIWTRSFAIILGSTVQSASATFAAFLVGLAAGAWIFGRVLPRPGRTVASYVGVELAIAIAAPLCGVLIHRNADALAVWIGAGHGPRVFSAFTTVLVLVLLPTLFMGATFPMMLACARRLGAPLASIGRLYALNTAGAAFGTLLCGFLLIRFFGVERTLWIGAACNVAAALLCAPLIRFATRDDAQPVPAAAQGESSRDGMLLAVAAASGVLVLGLEVVWTRFAGYFLGNRTYAFTTLLACVLVLLAIGSWLSTWLVTRFARRLPALLGWTLAAGALSSLGAAASAWWWIHHQGAVEAQLPFHGQLLLLYRIGETFALLALPLVTLGCLFPASLMGSEAAQRSTGRAAGRFYVANTAGAVVGSLGVGFWGVNALGAFGSVAALGFLAGAVGLAAFAVEWMRSGQRRSALGGMAAVVGILLSIPVLVPARLTVLREREDLLFRTEDEYGVMQVVRTPEGTIRVTNNRTELIYHLGLVATSFVQEMQGHLPVFHRPDARTALVIGNGYGVTAGALLSHPGLEKVVAVEIVPGMFDAADLFEPYNHAYHRDPRTTLVVDDGRHYLARSHERFDIISVNVTDAHLPGSASLFHTDFYALAKQRMTPDGVLVQHAFGSGLEVILRTLLASFADVRLYPAYGNGYNVLASDRSLDVLPSRVDSLLGSASVRSALANIGVLPPITPSAILASGIRREEIESRLAPGPLATDDRPLLEFAWDGGSHLFFSNE
ncbi:MAG TPA: fused MFS/spermidine synthase [Myxococcota bacterium]|nr:fused MFS/spermidine synthase [Myxococcota bacterium]